MKLNRWISLFVALSAAMPALAASTHDANLTLAAADAAKPATPWLQSAHVTGVTTAFAEGDPVGVIQSGPQCESSTSREWSQLIQHRIEADLPVAFQEEMTKVAPLASSKRSRSTGDLEVKAFVNDLKVRVCDLGKGSWRGGFYVQVSWQVARRNTNRIIYQGSTSGVFDRQASQPSMRAASGLHEALAVSVRNLLADQRFASILQTSDDPAPQLAVASQ